MKEGEASITPTGAQANVILNCMSMSGRLQTLSCGTSQPLGAACVPRHPPPQMQRCPTKGASRVRRPRTASQMVKIAPTVCRRCPGYFHADHLPRCAEESHEAFSAPLCRWGNGGSRGRRTRPGSRRSRVLFTECKASLMGNTYFCLHGCFHTSSRPQELSELKGRM